MSSTWLICRRNVEICIGLVGCSYTRLRPLGAVLSVGSDMISPRKGNVIGRLSVQKREKIQTHANKMRDDIFRYAY